MNDSGTDKTLRRAAIVLMTAIVVTGLYVGQGLLIPLALAIFLSLLLNAPVRLLQRIGVGRNPAVAIVFISAMLTVASMGWVVFSQASTMVSELPRYRQNIEAKISNVQENLANTRSRAASFAESLTKGGKSASAARVPADESGDAPTQVEPVVSNAGEVEREVRVMGAATTTQPMQVEVIDQPTNLVATVGKWWGSVTHPFATAGLTAILLLFLLIHREDLRDRLLCVCGRAHIQITTAALADSETRVVRFFTAQLISNILVGVAVGIGLLALGVPKAALWGLMLAILRFIPFLGPLVAVGFPAILSAAIFDGWMIPILVIVLAVSVDLLAGNLLEPWLFGIRVGASAPAIFLSFIVWGSLWGPAGLILATPIMVCLIVLGKHVPVFEVFYVLFGNEPVLEPSLRFYQRLLALNPSEAKEVVKKQVEASSTSETLETVVWPGLSMVESDRLEGLIDAARTKKTKDIASEIITKLIEEGPADAQAPVTRVRPVRIMLLPDRGTFDDLVTPLVEADIRRRGNVSVSVPASALVSEIVQKVEQERPDILAFCAIEPKNVDRIVHIHKRLDMARTPVMMNVLLISGTKRSPAQRRRLSRLSHVQVRDSLADFVTGMEPGGLPQADASGATNANSGLGDGIVPKPVILNT